jgi:cytochrome c-type biogenesis protein CcmH/NrfG
MSKKVNKKSNATKPKQQKVQAKAKAEAQIKAKEKPEGLSIGAKIVIVIFALLMVVSLLLPSLSAVFSSIQSSTESSEQSSSTDSDSDSSTDSSDSDSDSSDDSSSASSSADEKYSPLVESLEAKYAEDSTNLATLLNLGKNYMSWGVTVTYSGTTDSDTSHANELLTNAVKYFDEYLALKDSSAVKVDRALCLYYEEDTSGALSALQALTEEAPDYGPGWANLGMLYEVSGDTDKATEAYNKAIETDPDDEYGSKTYAENRISSIESAASSSSDSSSSSSSTSTTSSSSSSTSTGVSGLSETLSSLSGTSL